jgi:holo-[acyl-carrier protein] synthase
VIVGLGIDLLENARVERELARAGWAASDGIFTPDEIAYCNGARRPARRYAACFAAKEAALKAFNLPAGDLASFREVEVRAAGTEFELAVYGRLKARSEELGVRQIRLSVAGSAQHTSAMVILED